MVIEWQKIHADSLAYIFSWQSIPLLEEECLSCIIPDLIFKKATLSCAFPPKQSQMSS